MWMWSIVHFTNNLNYLISLNNVSIFCYRLALELFSSLKQDAFQFSLKARLVLLPGWVREEAPGEYHKLCVSRRLDPCSVSFLSKERGNDGGVLTCSSQNSLQCLKLPVWSSPTLLSLCCRSVLPTPQNVGWSGDTRLYKWRCQVHFFCFLTIHAG